jgi:hypothetical protein
MAEIDDVFHEFAAAFAGAFRDSKPICFPDKLDRSKLDLTLPSLLIVDAYLTHLHLNSEQLKDEEWHSTVLYGGAYVGEVIRNEAKNHFSWIDYDDYMAEQPELKLMIPERTVATCAFLVDDKGAMSMPLNKVARFIDEGQENSVHFFAQCDIAKAKDA